MLGPCRSVLAQLLFWRPVAGYQPSAEGVRPDRQIIDLLRPYAVLMSSDGPLVAARSRRTATTWALHEVLPHRQRVEFRFNV